jgi:two-component sensor histidine kinase
MPNDAMRHGFRVFATPEQVPLARWETAKVLGGWGLREEVVTTACLIVTELVTNVVRHAAVLSPTAEVGLVIGDGALTLEVADSHPFQPKALPAPHDLGGRGLHMVKALVEEVRGQHDVIRDEASGGKRIVIRLPLAAALA